VAFPCAQPLTAPAAGAWESRERLVPEGVVPAAPAAVPIAVGLCLARAPKPERDALHAAVEMRCLDLAEAPGQGAGQGAGPAADHACPAGLLMAGAGAGAGHYVAAGAHPAGPAITGPAIAGMTAGAASGAGLGRACGKRPREEEEPQVSPATRARRWSLSSLDEWDVPSFPATRGLGGSSNASPGLGSPASLGSSLGLGSPVPFAFSPGLSSPACVGPSLGLGSPVPFSFSPGFDGPACFGSSPGLGSPASPASPSVLGPSPGPVPPTGDPMPPLWLAAPHPVLMPTPGPELPIPGHGTLPLNGPAIGTAWVVMSDADSVTSSDASPPPPSSPGPSPGGSPWP